MRLLELIPSEFFLRISIGGLFSLSYLPGGRQVLNGLNGDRDWIGDFFECWVGSKIHEAPWANRLVLGWRSFPESWSPLGLKISFLAPRSSRRVLGSGEGSQGFLEHPGGFPRLEPWLGVEESLSSIGEP